MVELDKTGPAVGIPAVGIVEGKESSGGFCGCTVMDSEEKYSADEYAMG